MTAVANRKPTGSSESTTPPARASKALGLEEVLGLLPPKELKAIITGLSLRVDTSKRIGVAAQVARALLSLPEARDPSHLPAPARELLHRIIEARGVLKVKALPAAVEPLVAKGLVFARAAEDGRVELLLPIAYIVQMASWEGEDPRGIRSLLTQVGPSVQASIASHHLGSAATNPIALSLEAAWANLSDAEYLAREVAALAPAERKLLLAIEELGGEVDTEELLGLEREPMRLRGAAGATPSRRGVGFALERRGFLLPLHPNRHVIPSELVRCIGARRREQAEGRRAEIRRLVEVRESCPRRAAFAQDPAALALAISAHVRERGVEIKPDLGTPRSLVSRLAARFGQDPRRVALVASLCRALGLWDASARNPNSPPGSLALHELSFRFFEVWREGGAWDEARPDGEVLRSAGAAREPSVVGVVRAIVLESLMDLGEDRWVPWEAIRGFVMTDGRAPGLSRLLERWAERCGIPAAEATLPRVAERIAFESLHLLGCVDVGGEESDAEQAPSPAKLGSGSRGPVRGGRRASGGVEARDERTLRITSRGRHYLAGEPAPARRQSVFRDTQILRVGDDVRVAQVLSLVPFTELGRIEGQLELKVSTGTVQAALGAGLAAHVIRQRLAAVVTVPAEVAEVLTAASAVVGRAQLVVTPGFLWVDDAQVREMLRSRRATVDLFLDPSPPGGLLLAPGVDWERLVVRCRTLGVEVTLCTSGARASRLAGGGPESESRARSGTRRRTRPPGVSSASKKARSGSAG